MKSKYLYGSIRFDIKSGQCFFISNETKEAIALQCGDELETLSEFLFSPLVVDDKQHEWIKLKVGYDLNYKQWVLLGMVKPLSLCFEYPYMFRMLNSKNEND